MSIRIAVGPVIKQSSTVHEEPGGHVFLTAFPILRNRTALLILGVVSLGVLARATRYLPAWAAWGDEMLLACNLFHRNYAELLLPLDNNQVAPVGFLWATKLVTNVLGFHELSLRLIPFLASVGALLLTVRLARRMTNGWAFALAVGVFAVSHYHVRHGAEIKQYATDCFFSTALLTLAISAMHFRRGAAAGLLALVPIALLSSFPAVFVAGGIGIALLPNIWKRRSWRWWIWYAGYNAAVALSFSGLYFLVLKPQLATHSAVMLNCWRGALPNLESPMAFLIWALRTASGSIFAHPIGGENFGSLPFAVLFWVGVVSLWRQGERFFPRLVGATFLLAVIAALMHKYPLGGHARLGLYLAPLVTIPIGAGMAALMQWRVGETDVLRRRAAVAIGFLVCVGLGNVIKDLSKPYINSASERGQSFAQWFWTDFQQSAPGPLLAVSQDAGEVFGPHCRPRADFEYLRARYASSASVEIAPIPSQVDKPMGLVAGVTAPSEEVQLVLNRWCASLAEHYDVFRRDAFAVTGAGLGYEVVWIRPKPAERLAEQEPTASSRR